jgi:hypothetical protein
LHCSEGVTWLSETLLKSLALKGSQHQTVYIRESHLIVNQHKIEVDCCLTIMGPAVVPHASNPDTDAPMPNGRSNMRELLAQPGTNIAIRLLNQQSTSNKVNCRYTYTSINYTRDEASRQVLSQQQVITNICSSLSPHLVPARLLHRGKFLTSGRAIDFRVIK